MYAKKLSELTKISYDNILVQLKKNQKREKNKNEKNFGNDYIPKKRDAESAMIKMIVENPSYFAKIKGRITKESFKKEENKEIFEIFCSLWEENIKPDVSMVMDKLSKDSLKWASELFIEKEPVKNFIGYFEELSSKMNEKKFSFEDDDDIEKLLQYTKELKEKQKK